MLKNKHRIMLCTLLVSSIFLTHTEDRFDDKKPFYTGVDYLFWKAEADPLNFGFSFPLNENATGRFLIDDQCFKANSGFRLNAGYFFGDHWNIGASWTHLRTSSATALNDQAIFAVAITGILNNPFATSATAQWCFKFNTFDIELGHDWFICDLVELRPFIAVKQAKMCHTQLLHFSGLEDIDQANVIRKNSLSTVGPRLGIDQTWALFKNISLLGNISGSLLYGKLALDESFIFGSPDDEFTFPFVLCKKRLFPMMQMLVGIQWERVTECRPTIEMGIAYEAQYWWNVVQNGSSVGAIFGNVINRGDIMLHGLTLHLGIRF